MNDCQSMNQDHDHEPNNIPFEVYLRNVEPIVQEHGHAVVADLHRDIPLYFTHGLSRRNMPEIVLSASMSPKVGTMLINHLVNHFNEHGVQTGRLEDLFADVTQKSLPCLIRYMHVDRDLLKNSFPLLDFIHRDKSEFELSSVELVQLIWSDEDGNLATEQDFLHPQSIELYKERVLS